MLYIDQLLIQFYLNNERNLHQ